jgi:uncharacterized OB-fold protein
MDIVTHWRLKELRYRFRGAVCPSCAAPTLAQRPTCAQCGSETGTNLESKVFKSAPIPLQTLALLSKAEEVKR